MYWLTPGFPMELSRVVNYHYTGDLLDTVWRYEADGTTLTSLTIIEYYPDDRIKAVKSFQPDFFTMNIELIYVDSFGYSAGTDFYTFYKNTNYENGVEEFGFELRKEIGSNGLPEKMKAYNYEYGIMLEDSTIVAVTYTSYNNPEQYIGMLYE